MKLFCWFSLGLISGSQLGNCLLRGFWVAWVIIMYVLTRLHVLFCKLLGFGTDLGWKFWKLRYYEKFRFRFLLGLTWRFFVITMLLQFGYMSWWNFKLYSLGRKELKPCTTYLPSMCGVACYSTQLLPPSFVCVLLSGLFFTLLWSCWFFGLLWHFETKRDGPFHQLVVLQVNLICYIFTLNAFRFYLCSMFFCDRTFYVNWQSVKHLVGWF